MIIPARFPRKGTFDMLRAFVLASALIAVATATVGASCSAVDGIGSGRCSSSSEVCCQTATAGFTTNMGTGENTGTCEDSFCPVGKIALCGPRGSGDTINCPAGTCSGQASSTLWSISCDQCPATMSGGSDDSILQRSMSDAFGGATSSTYCDGCKTADGTTCDMGYTYLNPPTLGQPCSAEDGIGNGKCDSGQVCCTTSTNIGTGENTGTCRSGDEYSACNTGEEPLCSQATTIWGKPVCSSCSGTASTNTWSVPCNNCPNYLSSTSSTSSKTSCSGGTCTCSFCPSGTPSGGTCALNSSNSDWEDAASGLATGIIVVIVLCVLVFVVLPVVLCILICFCGVALCGMGAQAATQAPAANGGMTHAGAAQPQMTMGAANPQPPGATYMKNGVWLDANDRPVQS